MTLHTPNFAIPYPELTDTPDGATQMANIATTVDDVLGSVADDVATNATLATLLATLLGGAAQRYNAQHGALTGTTSTAYVDALVSGAGAATTFISPPSGIVGIDFGADGRSSATNLSAVFSPQVRQGATIGSGTVQLASNDTQSCGTNSQTNNMTVVGFHELTGLTPGATYNVVLQWKVSNTGSANGGNPRVRITPRLA